MLQERYSVDERELVIFDPVLNIDIHSRFDTPPSIVKQYHPNQMLEMLAYYKDRLLHGYVAYFDPTGVELSRAWFCYGKREGKAQKSYYTGQVYALERYKAGQREGEQRYFDLHGTLRSEMYYHKGLLHGAMSLFWPSGLLKRHAVFVHGKPVGKEIFWNQEGSVLREVAHEA